MKKTLLALLVGTSFLLAACGSEEASDDSSGNETVASKGEQLYQKSCIGCHGGNLEGGVGPALDKVGSTLSQEEIETIILEGVGSMPSGIYKGEEATQVAEWLAEQK